MVALYDKKAKVNEDYTSFVKRGNNSFILSIILFGIMFIYMAVDLYRDYGKFWLALVPVVFFVIVVFISSIMNAYRVKLRNRYRNPSMKLVGFNMDFNERILRRIYGSLTKYEFLDEDLTSFTDFYNVLILDFDEHESALYFKCTVPQLKYILEKFKQFKQGLRLKTFEKSAKVYHKGNLISSRTLSKKYSDYPPGREFEKLIDSFFAFLGDN